MVVAVRLDRRESPAPRARPPVRTELRSNEILQTGVYCTPEPFTNLNARAALRPIACLEAEPDPFDPWEAADGRTVRRADPGKRQTRRIRRHARSAERRTGSRGNQRKGVMKRLVVVADNPLIVGAIRAGLRDSGGFHLLGYVDPRKTTAARITQAGAEVVLVDEGGDSEAAIALIKSLREQDEDIKVIVLVLNMEGEWLERAFAAGADGAVSKAIHRAALATLIRETVAGHIIHSPASLPSAKRPPVTASAEHSALTERETEILRFVASGATNAEIARQLWITQQTVKFHVSNVYRKLDVANRTEACHYAHVNGMVATVEPLGPLAPSAPVLAIAS